MFGLRKRRSAWIEARTRPTHLRIDPSDRSSNNRRLAAKLQHSENKDLLHHDNLDEERNEIINYQMNNMAGSRAQFEGVHLRRGLNQASTSVFEINCPENPGTASQECLTARGPVDNTHQGPLPRKRSRRRKDFLPGAFSTALKSSMHRQVHCIDEINARLSLKLDTHAGR